MGSNVTKSQQTDGPTQRKSALKRRQVPSRPTGNDTTNDPFGTEVFQPVREVQPNPLTSQNERTAQRPVPEVPTERSIPRVHYEDESDVPVNRDGMVLTDTNRSLPSTNPRLNNRTWPEHEETNPDYSPRQYRSYIPHSYGPRPVAGRPYRQRGHYPYRSMPPSIYPYRPRGPRAFVTYDETYRIPKPVDERYRPAPVMHNAPRAVPVGVPVSDQPPPYHSLETTIQRRDHAGLPRERPQPIQEEADIFPTHDGDITGRSGVYQSNSDHFDREQQVTSLLSSEHLVSFQAAGNPIRKSGEAVHERDDDDYIGANLKFYRNQMKFRPNGETIDYVHKYWYGNYSLLEKLHTYIQWLFPLYDRSRVNLEAVPLRAHEAKHIYEDKETRNRFLTSFLMMLDFYGFSMTEEETGKIERAANWKERFNNLKRSSHNHTRITRILKCLGELGQSKLQTPFVMALFHEVFETQTLAGIPTSTLHHWLRSINDDFERGYVYKQFKQGLTRLEDERQNMKNTDSKNFHFERPKEVNESTKRVQFTTR